MTQHDRLFRIRTLAALSLLVLAPLTAEAAGEVKGVSATPSPATKGTPVTITVTGKPDPCQNVDLDFGDGTAHATYTGPLPKNFTHTYTTTGNKTITAKGVNNCKGQASASLTVQQSPLVLLLAIIDPKIDQVVPFISNITPGGYAAVKGSWFGTTEGELWLKGLKKWNGAPYGDVKLAIATEPGKDFWTPTSVLGIIYGTITGVKDQPAKLQIKTKAGLWSNEYSVNFKATKSYVTLPYTDPAVKLVSCGNDSNKDVCNGVVDPNDGDWFSSSCGQTFYGFHLNCWGCIGDDFGTDKFEITVKNGWVIDGGKIHVNVASGEGYTLGPGAVPSNGTSWKPSVQWNVSSNDDLCHGADVYISGPKGVPWK